jgi:hypothetical protein
MPSDLQQLQTIRAQTLARIADVTAQPKPTYDLEGQSVAWNEYVVQLLATVDWCERKLAGEDPFEIQSQGIT